MPVPSSKASNVLIPKQGKTRLDILDNTKTKRDSLVFLLPLLTPLSKSTHFPCEFILHVCMCISKRKGHKSHFFKERKAFYITF